jgi:hypothetical protein
LKSRLEGLWPQSPPARAVASDCSRRASTGAVRRCRGAASDTPSAPHHSAAR